MTDDKALSLSDEIGAALDAVDQSAPEAPVDGSEPPAEASEGRARDEHGRFAPKEAAAPVEGQPAPVTPSPDQPQTVSVPASWPKEDAAVFATLPPEVQATIARREQEREGAFTRAMQNIAEVERFHGALKPALNEHRAMFEAAGAPPEQVITNLLRLASWSQQDPKAYVRWAIENLGVNPQELNAPADEYADPALTELRQGYQRLNETVQQFQNRIRQQDEAAVKAEADQIRSTINQWAGQQNPDGTAKWPHFTDRNVQIHMGKLMEIDEQLTLDTAYERATRALGLPGPTPTPVKKPVPNLTSRGAGAGAKAQPENLRDTIAEAFDAMR